MNRFTLIEWLDAIAPLWTGEDHNGQVFIDRWWWDVYEELKWMLLDGTPMMVYEKSHNRTKETR